MIINTLHDIVIVVESFKDKAEQIMLQAYDLVVGGDNAVITKKTGEV